MPTERELRQSPSSGHGMSGSEGSVMAALSYVGIFFLVPMLFAKKTPFIRFHLRQGITIFVCGVVVSLVMWLPVIGWLLGVALFILAVTGILQALAGEARPLPLVGKYAAKIRL